MQCFSLSGTCSSIMFELHYSRENVGMHHSVTHNKDVTADNKKICTKSHRNYEDLVVWETLAWKTLMAMRPFYPPVIKQINANSAGESLHIPQQKEHYGVLGVKDVIVIRKLTTKVCDPPLVGSLLKVTKCNKILLSPAWVQSLVEYQPLFRGSCPPPHRGWAVLRRAGHMFTKDPES